MNQNFKGSLDTIILKLLLVQEEMYGYEITKKIEEITDGKFSIKEGSLYPALHRMESKGILTSITKPFKNRQRKYYMISEKGQKEAHQKIQDMHQFIEQMRLIMKTQWT